MARTPVRYPVVGTTDSTGKATIKITGRQAHYASLTFSAKAGGTATPDWEIDLDGTPELFGHGTRVVLGPMHVYPGQVISLTVTGDSASDQILGTLTGVQADTPEELNIQVGAPQIAGFSSSVIGPTSVQTALPDWQGVADPGTGTVAALTIGGQSGKIIFIAGVVWTLVNAAAAAGTSVRARAYYAGNTANAMFTGVMGCGAAVGSYAVLGPIAGIQGAQGQNVTFDFGVGIANFVEVISAWGYYR